MLVGHTGTSNLVLLVAGLVLIAAGIAAIRFREEVSAYLRDLRELIFGERTGVAAREPGRPVFPIIAGVILIGLGLIGAYGGLFAEIVPRTA